MFSKNIMLGNPQKLSLLFSTVYFHLQALFTEYLLDIYTIFLISNFKFPFTQNF